MANGSNSQSDGGAGPLLALKASLAAAGARRVLLAVSGGSDSLALLKLAAGARDLAEFSAATVDHGLRAASAQEAQWVARQAREAGLDHMVLKWTGEKPASAIQETARLARYRLLAGAAERCGCDAVMTAHTADDQAETLFMRLARGSGPRGLAGAAARSEIAAGAGAPILLLRPLLGITRQELRLGLQAAAQDWLDDPSNDDPRFERARLRGLLAALEEQSLVTRQALAATARKMRQAAERLDAADREALSRSGGAFHGMGFVRMNVAPAPASLIARLIRAVGACAYAPGEEDAARAHHLAIANGAATLGGALLKRQGERLYLCREGAALLGRGDIVPIASVTIPPAGRLLWDRRFILANAGPDPALVEPLGADGEALAAAAALNDCPKEALAAAPRVIGGKGASVNSLLLERFDEKVMRIP